MYRFPNAREFGRRCRRGASALVLAASAVLALACDTGPTAPTPLKISYDFRQGPQGWTCDAAGYSILGFEPDQQFIADYRPLMGALAVEGSSWSLRAFNNLSTDLLIFCKIHVPGLAPSRTYTTSLTAEIATNQPPGCFGIGGPKGEAINVKAGLARSEPIPFTQGTNIVTSLDKGQNALVSGGELVILGNIVNSAPAGCAGDAAPWELKTLTRSGVSFVSSPAGGGWLVAGIHMAFIGPIRVYLTKVKAEFQ